MAKKTIKSEQPPIWSFFCENENEKEAMESGSQEEAFNNILNTDESEFLISRVENLVQKRLAKSITGSQLRKLFDIVQKEQDSERQDSKIRIQLIYIAARQNNPTAQNFAQFIKELIIRKKGNCARKERFKLFMESIVSYHKYYSKK